MKINIVDCSFGSDKSLVAGKVPKYIEWDKTVSQTGRTFYTNKEAFTKREEINRPANFLLTEPTTIIRYNPEIISELVDKFDYIFTHDSRYLNIWPDKCRWIPGGGIWIGGRTGEGNIGLFAKTKLCSMVSSAKIFCPLHLLRAHLAKQFQSRLDLFGTILGNENWVPINKTLEDYAFSIIIENHIDDLYFTEKLLNCFATGTIPIYIGARNIAEKFNIDGIIHFNTREENKNAIVFDWVDYTLTSLSMDLYNSKIEAVKDNFERCLQYETIEDYIYSNYMECL